MTTAHSAARWLRGLWLAIWLFFVSAVAACFPAPLTCEELAAEGQRPDRCIHDDTDSSQSTDTGGLDATALDVADSELADSVASDAATDSGADDTSPDTTTTPDTSDATVTDATGFEIDDDTGPDVDDDTTPDTDIIGDETTADTGGEVVETNECGGVGTVGPGLPGDPCGPCLDGEWVCDPDDDEHRTTRCVEASAVDACGGCGLAHPLGDPCNDCGTYACDPAGSTAVICVEPEGGCPVILTCADLDCGAAFRTCIESDGVEDAFCGGCVASHVLVGSACVPRIFPPTTVTASTDRGADVEITWDAAANATGYRVYRCDAVDCTSDAAWHELTASAITERTYVDGTAVAPATPNAPTGVGASKNRTGDVRVSWSAVVAPLAPRYRYRVTTTGAAGESAPSDAAEGARAERPVIGYEVQIAEGPWTTVPGGLVTQWDDVDASPATLGPGTATASLGTFAGYVSLSVSGANATVGVTRSYRVRALTAYGPTAVSSSADGWRVAGALTYAWERSADASASGFAAIAGATGTTFNDTNAPADGSTRWYRVVVSATGAVSVPSDPVPGARQAPPNVPGGVHATFDLTDRVVVDWEPVSDALGYHVYRDGVKLTSGNGVATPTYTDFGAPAPSEAWGAPTGVSATTIDPTTVTVTWVAPTRPVGPSVTYRVSAQNAAGEGPLSGAATGNRAALALVGFDVEVTPAGGNASWVSTGVLTTSWSHTNAPLGVITAGMIMATQGDHMAHVRLVSSGASVSTPASVSYRVRGALQGGASYTATSTSATGRRGIGALTYQWQRSSGTSASDYALVSGATTASFDDTTAPNDGSKRWYQLALSAAGAAPVVAGPAEGWRLAFVNVATSPSDQDFGLSVDGEVWTWSGTGVPSRMTLPEGLRFAELAVGPEHRCGRTSTGQVWCWGENGSGQLGIDSVEDTTTPTQVLGLGNAISIAAGATNTCAVVDTTRVMCWGSNTYGQIGNTNSGGYLDKPVSPVMRAGVTTGDPTLLGAVSVVIGTFHACARLQTSVRCWGRNDTGQLGNGGSSNSSSAVQVSDLGAVLALSTGSHHTCAVSPNGGVSCWGRNTARELGAGLMSASSPTPVVVLDVATATSIALTERSGCARLAAGSVACWGSNSYGEHGASTSIVTATEVPSVTGATMIGAGIVSHHICALTPSGIWCWGAEAGSSARPPYAIALP